MNCSPRYAGAIKSAHFFSTTPMEQRMTQRPSAPPVRKYMTACGLALLLVLTVAAGALAHPLGNFTVNRYSRWTPAAGGLLVHYVLDMAEIPAHSERSRIDGDGDGVLSQAEQDGWRVRQAAALLANLQLTANGEAVALAVHASTLTFPEGQAGLPTLRLTVDGFAALPAMAAHKIAISDGNFADRLGWQELIVTGGAAGTIAGSTAPATDLSDELRSYPADLLTNPPAVTTASFSVHWAAGANAQPGLDVVPKSQAVAQAVTQDGRPADGFAELITLTDLGPGSLALALLLAFGWGALHALAPGHGKTIVAAYLVGARGTTQHALFLGFTTTITHTAGVFAVGLITLALSNWILPEMLFPWLSLLSGLLVVVIGLSLVVGRLPFFGPGHGAEADHRHAPGMDWEAHLADGHHARPSTKDRSVSWRSLLALGISGGLLPCPSALVLMLGAIALQRVGLGLLLILVFSLGLAGVLTLIGILLVHAGQLLDRAPQSGRLLKLAPVASAAFITVVGLVISWQALQQTGVFPG
jgi:ABC-type nickel/cobalt efflux system permease component RcnA